LLIAACKIRKGFEFNALPFYAGKYAFLCKTNNQKEITYEFQLLFSWSFVLHVRPCCRSNNNNWRMCTYMDHKRVHKEGGLSEICVWHEKHGECTLYGSPSILLLIVGVGTQYFFYIYTFCNAHKWSSRLHFFRRNKPEWGVFFLHEL